MSDSGGSTPQAAPLTGRTFFVTGATGFVGTAVLERLLRLGADEVVVLVRDGRRRSAAERLQREILRNNAFDPLRAELGDEDFAELASRVRAVSGDVGVTP
jgi:fatty acyl-CoA reductase